MEKGADQSRKISFFAYVGRERHKSKRRLCPDIVAIDYKYNPLVAIRDPKVLKAIKEGLRRLTQSSQIYSIYARVGQGQPIKIDLDSIYQEQPK